MPEITPESMGKFCKLLVNYPHYPELIKKLEDDTLAGWENTSAMDKDGREIYYVFFKAIKKLDNKIRNHSMYEERELQREKLEKKNYGVA